MSIKRSASRNRSKAHQHTQNHSRMYNTVLGFGRPSVPFSLPLPQLPAVPSSLLNDDYQALSFFHPILFLSCFFSSHHCTSSPPFP